MFTEQQWSPFLRYFTWPSDGWTDANRAADQSIPNYYGFILMDDITPVTANYYNADIKSWDNEGADSKWGTVANWTTDTKPDAATLAILPQNSIVEVDAVQECFDLLIETGSTLDIETTYSAAKGLTVGGNLTNNAGFSGLTIKAGGGQHGGYLIHNTENVDATIELYFPSGLWHYMSSPVDNFSIDFDELGLGLTGGLDEDQFYYWDESIGTWIDILNSSLYENSGFKICEGYIINYTSGNPIKSFAGKLIHDDQSITLTKASKGDYDGWNLIGNPFAAPLAINSNAAETNNLLAANSGIIDPATGLYFWAEIPGWTEEDGARDYVARNNTTITGDNPYVPAGQSFMVKALNDDVDFSFPANCRVGVASQYLKNAKDDFQRLSIGIENPELDANVLKIVFAENCTDGPDAFYDALKFKGNPNLAFYSTLVSGDNRDFEIQSLAPLTEEKEVYLGLDAEITGVYTMFVDTLVNFTEDYTFEIEDTQTGAIINLKQAKYFTFNVNETGAFKNRFILRFKSTVGIHENITQQVDLFEMYATNQIIYLNTTEPSTKANVSVFNTLGQQVISKKLHGQSTQIRVDEPGTYIVRVQTGQGVQSRKAIVF
jgi:hypothetical protein